MSPKHCHLAERACSFGIETLTDEETLELFLRRSIPAGAKTIAAVLLARFHTLQHVLSADIKTLATVVGAEPAADLKLLHSTTSRLLRFDLAQKPLLSSSTALKTYLIQNIGHRTCEVFKCLFLDKKNQLIADEIMWTGTVDHAPAYPREIIKRALELNASAMILCHQHPSGDPTPSGADIAMTKEIIDAAKCFHILVHDHIVVGGTDTASFKALGLI